MKAAHPLERDTSPKSAPLRLGLVGLGQIAEVVAEALNTTKVAEIPAVWTRDAAKRERFAARFTTQAATDLASLFRDFALDAVYVATPHPSHAAIVAEALRAGLGVLCEKPMSLSPAETAQLFALSAAEQCPLLEGWMYRAHPQFLAALRLVADGAIGQVRHFESSFAFSAPYDQKHRLFAKELGGGAILDVGGYPYSMALALAAAMEGDLDSLEPKVGHRFAQIAIERTPEGVDTRAGARLEFAHGLCAELFVATTLERPRAARIIGETGMILMEDPYLPSGQRLGRRATLWLHRKGQEERLDFDAELDCFSLEIQELARLCARPKTDPARHHPRVPFASQKTSLLIAQGLEAWQQGTSIRLGEDPSFAPESEA